MTQERRDRSLIGRFYIDRSYQLKYTLMVVVLTTAITAVFGYMYYRNEAAKTEILQIQNPDLASMLSSSDHTVLFSLLGFFVFQFIVIFFFGLFYTHRVAGPVYRLKKYFERIETTGEVSDFEGVRNKDEFPELFEVLSRAITKVQYNKIEVRFKLEEIKKHLASNQSDQAKRKIDELISKF